MTVVKMVIPNEVRDLGVTLLQVLIGQDSSCAIEYPVRLGH